MNIKALIATLVIGSSSAAVAVPAVASANPAGTGLAGAGPHDFGPAGEPNYYPAQPRYAPSPEPEHRNRPFWRRQFSQRPVVLASGAHFSGDGRTFITVPDLGRRFRALQISAAGGRTFIDQVYVEFENGQEQVIRNIGARLRGHESVTLDLDGNQRRIRRVVVYGRNLGWRSSGGFNLTAV